MRKVKIRTGFDCTMPGEKISRMHYKGEELELEDAVAKSAVDSGAGVYLDMEPAAPAPAPDPEPEPDDDE